MIKIKNNTLLSYKTLGYMIDKYKLESKDKNIYVGFIDKVYFDIDDKYYKLEVKYGKRDVTYTFSNAKG